MKLVYEEIKHCVVNSRVQKTFELFRIIISQLKFRNQLVVDTSMNIHTVENSEYFGLITSRL